MRLESARGLKAEMLANLVEPLNAVAAGTPHPSAARVRALGVTRSSFAVGAKPPESLPHVHRSIAIGIGHRGGQFQLAVRVQRQALMSSRLVAEIVQKAHGEADVRLVGRIDKRARRPARTRGAAPRRAPVRRGSALARALAAVPWHQQNTRPLLIGASVGHVDVTAGTIGGFVRRAGQVCILSNNHVLANENRGAAGDAIIQRGAFDGGRAPADRVAGLGAFVRMKGRGANFVDAALAPIDEGIEHDPNRLRGLLAGTDRRLGGLGPDFLDIGEVVRKVGRTTGATEGRVTAFDLDNVVVNYDIGNLRFDSQIEIEGAGDAAFSDGGDSGSIIVNADLMAVALLFAGGDSGGSNGLGLTYANPIHRVLADLKATLLF